MKARCRDTGQFVAIKLIEDIFSDTDVARCVIREINILRKLSKMEGNIFTIKLIDVIVPTTEKRGLSTFKDLFLVMEYIEQDLK